MERSTAYLTVLLKDQLKSMKKLLRYRKREHEDLCQGKLSGLADTITRIAALQGVIERRESEKRELMNQLQKTLNNPVSQVEKIQKAVCELLLRELRNKNVEIELLGLANLDLEMPFRSHLQNEITGWRRKRAS